MSHARREQEDNSGESCDECNLKYSNPSDLRNHIRIVHIAKNKPVVTEKNNEEIQDEKTEDSSRMMVDSIMEDIFINLIQENERSEVESGNKSNISEISEDTDDEQSENETSIEVDDSEDSKKDTTEDGKANNSGHENTN